MHASDEVDRMIYDKILRLHVKHKREVLSFIEFLQIKQDREFIDYVNTMTSKAINDQKAGKKFISLKELQAAYDSI